MQEVEAEAATQQVALEEQHHMGVPMATHWIMERLAMVVLMR